MAMPWPERVCAWMSVGAALLGHIAVVGRLSSSPVPVLGRSRLVVVVQVPFGQR